MQIDFKEVQPAGSGDLKDLERFSLELAVGLLADYSVRLGASDLFIGMGVHPHFLCMSLLGVIGQRLVRTLNPETRMRLDLSHAPQTFAEVRPWLEPGEGECVYAAAKDADEGEGYLGRCGAYELFSMSPGLVNLISAGRPTGEIARQAIEDGMIDFRRASLIKVAQGVTSFDEISRAVPTADQWVGR